MAVPQRLALLLGLGLYAVLAGCGGGASSTSGGGGNGGGGGTPAVTPTISSISPTSVIAGAGPVTLTVNGTNFLSTSTVEVNSQSETTTFVSATQLTAAIPAAQLTSTGSLSVVVLNGSVSSGSGTSVSLAVNNPSIGALILNPSVLPIGGTAPVTVTVTGNTFVPASVVNVNGNARATTYVNSTTLTFDATVADQAAQATLGVTVTNPAPGGGHLSSCVAVHRCCGAGHCLGFTQHLSRWISRHSHCFVRNQLCA